MMHTFLQNLGLVASIVLPFFNIPLMMRMYQRKSSGDLSLIWVVGVFICILGMTPSAVVSPDLTFRIFAIVNLLFFSGVTFMAVWYRWHGKEKPS